ncbi:MAG: aldehyde dehydrogenase family protein [Actinomycetota bacterium]
MNDTTSLGIQSTYGIQIGHDERPGTGGMMPVYDPSSGQQVSEVPIASARDVDDAVAAAASAHSSWRALSVAERGDYLRRLAEAMRANRDRLAAIDALDSGNPYEAMKRDLDYAAQSLEYFAGIARELGGRTLSASPDGLHMTLTEPYGVVARIIPFNHPLMFSAYHIAAPLVAGNTVVLKAPDQTPIAPLEFGRLASAVLPDGVLSVLTGDGRTTGEAVVAHPDIRRIGFTGRRETGLRVIEAAAQSGYLKNVTVELGGKNPMIVFPDADPAFVAEQAVAAMNFESSQGQSCGSTSRLLVHESLRAEVVEALHARMASIVVGPALAPTTTMGPLVSSAQAERVMGFIDEGRRTSRLVLGGDRSAAAGESGGYYVAPTLFDDVAPEHLIAREEIFGPVLSVMSWKKFEDVMQIANRTNYGLTANIITNNYGWALDAARKVEAGCVWINGRGQHYLDTPFGGYKDSGLGAEGSMESLRSYTRTKALHMLNITPYND